MNTRPQTLPFDRAALQQLGLDSVGGDGQKMAPPMKLALDANFGSVQRWRGEFVALGPGPGSASGTRSGLNPGWPLLVFKPHDGTLVNQWAADHTHVPPDAVPILALDLHAPAMRPLFSAAADAFLAHIHWAAVYDRYQHAVHAASETCGSTADALVAERAGTVLLDVRRAGVFEQAATLIPGARWCDPAAVALWAAELPADRRVVVYCVYGHEVGRATALRLRAAGVQARYLEGGIDGWQAAGRPLQAKAHAG